MTNHRNINRIATVLILAVLALPATVPAQEEVCEIPLFVKQSQGTANVMIVADNSGSMNAAILHDAYDKNIDWSGNFETSRTYSTAKYGNYEPNDFNSGWPSSPSAPLIASDNGEDGQYSGNYMNWIYFHATDIQRASLPQVTRIQVLKTVMVDIVDRSAQLKMGITVFQKTDTGGNIIGPIGKNHTALISIIEGITANSYTPLGETMETVLDYFGDKTQSPITSSCEYNFILLITDGLPTKDTGVSSYLWDADGDGNDPGDCASVGAPYSNSLDCSDHVDDVAYWMANRDVNPHIEDSQYVYTYVVGFSENAQLLQDTAENGQGLFFLAENAHQLTMSIEYALQDILRRISAGSAVAVVSTERGTNDRLYRGKFMPVDWDGYLECFSLPYQEDDLAAWEGGSLLAERNPSTRRIFTALDDRAMEFSESKAGELKDAMGAVDEAEAAELISWGRGNYVEGLRDRHGWVLGPIIHSTPVVVGAPAQYAMEEAYAQFQYNHMNRRKMVYVGANDGMVHGFDAETGTESWAFVPEFALPVFAGMADSAYCHTYTCDQTVTVADVKIDGTWRTVLTTGGGAGGSSIFAIDVTYPDAPELLWQEKLPNEKDYHSEIQVTMIGGTPVALVGGGLDIDNMEAFLYAYNMETGDLLGEVKLSENDGVLRNMATRPALVDQTLDGNTDLVYVGDMLGSIYRLKTDGDPNPANWDMTELYEGTQEITADPVVAYSEGGSIYVYFGTGAYIEDPDMESENQNSFLCVFDHHDGNTVTKGSMVNQTSSINDLGSSKGWYVNLWNHPSERVTQQAAVVAETVVFTSFAPSDDVCVSGGYSWLYQMRYGDGGRAGDEDSDDSSGRSVELGEGIASYPVVDLSAGEVVVQQSDASIEVQPIANMIVRMSVRAWQETFDQGTQTVETTPGDVQ